MIETVYERWGEIKEGLALLGRSEGDTNSIEELLNWARDQQFTPVEWYGSLFRNGEVATLDHLKGLERFMSSYLYDQEVEGFPILIHCLGHYIENSLDIRVLEHLHCKGLQGRDIATQVSRYIRDRFNLECDTIRHDAIFRAFEKDQKKMNKNNIYIDHGLLFK